MLIQALPPAIKKRSEQLEMPVLYAEAIRALEKCATMDEAKYYSDKSDALAAWAKIYGSEEDGKAAARLKLRAYARMGILAGELRPTRSRGGVLGSKPGPRSLLIENGLTDSQACAARRLARLPKEKFEVLLEKAPSPRGAYALSSTKGSTEAWLKFRIPIVSFRGYCRGAPASAAAKEFSKEEAEKARGIIREITDWLDAFEMALPK